MTMVMSLSHCRNLSRAAAAAAVLLTVAAPQTAAQIGKPKDRIETLERLEAATAPRERLSLETLEALKYPFSLPIEEPEPVETTEAEPVVAAATPKETVTAPEPVRLTPREVLQRAAERLNITGAMERVGKRYIVQRLGRPIPEGTRISVTMPTGDRFTVVVAEVSDNSYTIKLDEEELEITFREVNRKGITIPGQR